MKNSPRISIIIPVCNGDKKFHACLQSLERYLPRPELFEAEVIVVADGCTDGSGDLARKLGHIVLSTPSPSGSAKARNLVVQQAQGELLL